MASRGTTRERVLATAQVLFQRQGYHATGVTQILEEAAAPKGSLYHHFPGGKEQLATESIRLGIDELGETIEAAIADAPDPPAAIRRMVNHLADRLEQSGYRDGCPMASVALDAADVDAIREVCQAGYDRWQLAIADVLVDAGLPRHEATDVAVMVLSTIEGGLLLARTRRDTAGLHTIAEQVAQLVANELAS